MYLARIVLLVVSLSVLITSYIGPCDYNINRCLGGNSIIVIRTLFHIFLSIFIISPFLFLISDKVFLKWLQFAGIWILLSIIAIAATPDRHNFLSLGPDRETVSIWMGSLFVIISLVKISWDSRSQKG